MAETSQSKEPSRSGRERVHRVLVALFVGLVMLIVAIDTAPPFLIGATRAKAIVDPFLNFTGLWQGRWTLFAPNPKINNTWLSAEAYQPDGQLKEMWNSTYWPETKGWERFLGFRHINYNNRIQTIDKSAADDLADYLAKELISKDARPIFRKDPVRASETGQEPEERPWRIVLSRSELNISLPDDGTLPPREETMWISSSENLTVREYQP